MESVFFLHITDIHINKAGKQPLFGLNMADKLHNIFEEIGKLDVKPAFVVISGDLTHDGDTEDYRFLKYFLEAETRTLGIPIHVALGNHDTREAFREGYLEEEPSDASYYYSFMSGGLRVIVLNTQVPGSHDGLVDAEQLVWLKQELAEPAPKGTILVHHHPVVLTPTAMMDSHLLQNPQELAAAIEGSDVIGLLSGHIHFHNIGVLNGIPCASADGSAFGLDPMAEGCMRMLDRSGFNYVLVKNGQMIVQPMTMPGEQRVLVEYDLKKLQAAHS